MKEVDEVTPGSGPTREERRKDPSRVLALTDGVFAIIITLLVLDIHVPELSAHETLQAAISAMRPSFLAFAAAFIVASMQWGGHRDLFMPSCRSEASSDHGRGLLRVPCARNCARGL